MNLRRTPTAGHDLTGPSWSTEDIDVQSYFAVLGITPDPEPSLSQLERIQGAHVRALPFSNVDVLLQQHPGISPSDVSTRLLHESRGGMCFEHTQLMAAALESLGYTVERRQGRVHEVTNSRTHAVLVVNHDGRRYLLDPGFGLSSTGPLELVDGAEREESLGTYRISRQDFGGTVGWALSRNGETSHITDELPVVPHDIRSGHFVIASDRNVVPFHRSLVVSKFVDQSHVTVTSTHRTVRRPGQPTEQTSIGAEEVITTVHDLGVRLTAADEDGLRRHLAGVSRNGHES